MTILPFIAYFIACYVVCEATERGYTRYWLYGVCMAVAFAAGVFTK